MEPHLLLNLRALVGNRSLLEGFLNPTVCRLFQKYRAVQYNQNPIIFLHTLYMAAFTGRFYHLSIKTFMCIADLLGVSFWDQSFFTLYSSRVKHEQSKFKSVNLFHCILQPVIAFSCCCCCCVCFKHSP